MFEMKQKAGNERGAALVLVALSMVALLSAVALAVDVGMLVTARTEAASLADATALAGAGVLLLTKDSAQAHDAAVAFGSTHNTVRGQHVPVLDEDVSVVPAEWTVRVDVHRVASRGNAVPTFFARVFGVGTVDISSHAAAWAVESSTIGSEEDPTCPALPLALLDKYIETNGDDGWQPPEPVVGWSAADHGTLVRLKVQPAASKKPEPAPVTNQIDYCNDSGGNSWRCWWRLPNEAPNTGNVSDKIRGLNCTDPVSLGDNVFNASGNMQSNVIDDFQWLMNQDPDLEWCPTCASNGCVVRAPSNQCFEGQSMRLRSVPIVQPQSVNGNGSNINANVIGFMGVFVEKVAETYAGSGQGSPGKRNVYLRFITEGGVGSGTPGGGNDPEAFVRTLQLIE